MIRIHHCGPFCDKKAPRPRDEAVVLLHGMLSSCDSMGSLAKMLQDNGYQVTNWSYPSLWHSIAKHARRLWELLDDLNADPRIGRIHFVTHSMGGIIARCALREGARLRAGRMVMLAPPNSGSRLARIPLGPFRGVFPALSELSQSADSFVNALPEPRQLEVGVIAAATDQVVDLASTYLRCQRDHVIVPGGHNALPRRPETGQQVLHFLTTGRFASRLWHKSGTLTEGRAA